MQVVPFNPAEAKVHKIAFYSLPQDIDYSKIDTYMVPILKKINSSGWVWTAESCQGHPDIIEPTGWDHNPNPYLRLVVNGTDLGKMLHLLTEACRGRIIELHTVERGPWLEVLIYVKAINVYQRNEGLCSLEIFADSLYDIGKVKEKPVYPKSEIKPVLLASRLRALAEKVVIDPRFRVSIGSGVTSELQALFRAAADAADENEGLKCQLLRLQETEQIGQYQYKTVLFP